MTLQPIAIVGMAGLFPDALDLDTFWTNIVAGKCSTAKIPTKRWGFSAEQIYQPGAISPDKSYSDKGCLVEDFAIAELLDLESLGLEPSFVASLDPLFHFTLLAGVRAFEQAITDNVDRRKTGVIIGNIALPTEKSSALSWEILGAAFEKQLLGKVENILPQTNPINRYVNGLPAGILSKALKLGAGCYTIDAACASSLYAIKFAMDELRSGRADMMLSGGVSRPDCLYTQMGFSQLGALSNTGVCAPFDKKHNGLVIGEGAGFVVLKRLEDAIAAGDHIHALITGAGIANDIKGDLLAPHSEGQLRCMNMAYHEAGWQPQDIDFIECHATGTPMGDNVELQSLRKLWGENPGQKCVLGAVKSNIGHLLTAAGAAGLIKTVLAIENRTLPAIANFEEADPAGEMASSPFYVVSKATEWHRRGKNITRKAAVNAFGFGGINGHLLIEEWQPRQKNKQFFSIDNNDHVDIAIVGMATHFGKWDSVENFHREILQNNSNQACAAKNSFGVNNEKYPAFTIEQIDTTIGQFRIPPNEIKEMLPQQLLMLEVAAQALKHARLDKKDHLRSGAFIGISHDLNTGNFHVRWSMIRYLETWARQLSLEFSPQEKQKWLADLRNAAGPALNAARTMGALGSIVASRVTREFHFGGPGISVSSEESSGAGALALGLSQLTLGEIDTALVGAVDFAADIRALIGFAASRPYSSDGISRPFDLDSDGALFTDGAAAVVLKRLADAEKDGDEIYAVIKSVGTACGGEFQETTPSMESYQLALERAYQQANVEKSLVDYVEAHGSGVREEDALEAEVLANYFADGEYPHLGSVKANIGHTGAVSALASLIKTVFCLDRSYLPGLANSRKVPELLAKSFTIESQGKYWLRNRKQGPRKAGVSSFSMDGNCFHIVLESYQKQRKLSALHPPKQYLFAIYGDNLPQLLDSLNELSAMAAQKIALPVVAQQWHCQSREYQGKDLSLAILAGSSEELIKYTGMAGDALAQDSPSIAESYHGRIYYSSKPMAKQGKMAFVFPGDGNQYSTMGRNIALAWPQVLEKMDQKNLYLRGQMLPQYCWQPDADLISHHKERIIGQVVFGIFISELLQSFGLRPQAAIGYSLGESTALFALEAWKQRDLMLEKIHASRLFTEELAGDCRAAKQHWQLPEDSHLEWAAVLVQAPASSLTKAIAKEDRVYLLIENTPEQCIVGGESKALSSFLRKTGCRYYPISGSTVAHCSVVEEVQEEYHAFHTFETTAPKGIDYYSGAWGKKYIVTRESAADAITAHAIHGLNFYRLIEAAYQDGVRIFVELGPGASCTRMIGEILGEKAHMAKAVCPRASEEPSGVLQLLAALIAEGIAVDLNILYSQQMPETIVSAKKKSLSISVGTGPFCPPKIIVEQLSQKTLPDVRQKTANITEEIKTTHAQKEDNMPSIQEQTQNKTPASFPASFSEKLSAMQTAKAQAHESFLRFSQKMTRILGEAITEQMSIAHGQDIPVKVRPEPSKPKPNDTRRFSDTSRREAEKNSGTIPALDREKCMEFAVGLIGKTLGPEFAEIDKHPTRVRLPDEPLMLVDRILTIEGEPRSMTNGRVITEHDVLPGAWYLDGGRIPTCIAVESGQADLFLSGYLGIDFQTKGLAVYRLLDAVVTFHRDLPVPGDVIRYDIRILRFFRQGNTYLFYFQFDSTVDGQPLLTMRNGCAGFFTMEELAAGQGIVHTKLDLKPMPGKKPDDWQYPTKMVVEAYGDKQIEALRKGDLVGCFGPCFEGLAIEKPLTILGGRMSLVDRITHLNPKGGRFSLGIVRAEADIHPDDWFLTCHFSDDNVMPGTLMYECCMHTFRVFLLRMGWVAEENNAAWQPIPGIASKLKCRGQVIDTTRKAAYEITIKELGYRPEPYAIADALMYADGKPVVEITNMSIRLTGTNREKIMALWRNKKGDLCENRAPQEKKEPLYDFDKIYAFAVGKPSEAFGEPYRIFDGESRIIARLPGPPYQFLDRISEIHADPWKMVAGGEIEAQYDVPQDAWYFGANRQNYMPFGVILEIALQPCGWLAAYLGSALTSDIDISFRNLGGEAVQYAPIPPQAGTLTTWVKITHVASSGDTIVQHYDYQMTMNGKTVYKGNTYFGFFTKAALSNQLGIQDAETYHPTQDEIQRGEKSLYPIDSPFPGDQLRMVKNIDLYVADGGPAKLGYIRGTLPVDPSAWFFKAHFYQDPVIPGSLGLESGLQLLRYAAYRKWGRGITHTVAPGMTHEWLYRGQIIPKNKLVTVEMWIKSVDEQNKVLIADGLLSVDGLNIYQMKNFSLRAE